MTIDIGKNDLRETLYNHPATGPAWQIQLPREAVTGLHGLVVDLDANLIKPNPWFPPADTATAFYTGKPPVSLCIVPAANGQQIWKEVKID